MNELIIIRHGASEHHVNNIVGGWTDLPLTESGRRQAACVGEYLKSRLEGRNFGFYTSDLSRAKETATIIGQALVKEPQPEWELRELNNEVAKGLALAEAKKIRKPITEPAIDWIPYDQAESWRMMHTRIVGVMNRIAAENEDLAVVVSHANSSICIINWWLNIVEDHHLTNIMYELDPCSITHLKVDKIGCRVVVRMNYTLIASS